MTQMRSGISRRRSAARIEGKADYRARREEIIGAATEVFRSKGYAAASLNDVAVVLGTDRASLYYYVASKEALFEECVREAVSQNIRDADIVAAKDVSPRQKLEELIALLIRSQEQYYPTMFVYVQEDMARLASKDAEWAGTMIEATHRFERFFIDTLEEGVGLGVFRADLSCTLVANAIFGMTQWTHRWWVPGGRYSADAVIDAFTAILFRGIVDGGTEHG